MDNEEEMMIWTEHLSKSYGEKEAVCDLTLEIRRGEIFGLLGPKRSREDHHHPYAAGLTEPTGGSAYIDGKDCARQAIEVKRMVGYLPDNVGFYSDMTGRENLRFTGQLNGLPGDVTDRRIEELLEKVGMTEAADQKAGTYSRGMRQRLGIADVLMKDPKVVIMDEPTLGIDPEGMRELMTLIRGLAEDVGPFSYHPTSFIRFSRFATGWGFSWRAGSLPAEELTSWQGRYAVKGIMPWRQSCLSRRQRIRGSC